LPSVELPGVQEEIVAPVKLMEIMNRSMERRISLFSVGKGRQEFRLTKYRINSVSRINMRPEAKKVVY